jgi:MFS transporter, DHA1 family, multidrug resistance protein
MSRDLKTLSFSLFLWGFGESLFLFFQPIYLQQMGASTIEIGTILAIMGFALGFAQIPIGHLSDQIGVKIILRTSWIIGTLATAMMALAPNISFYILGMLVYTITGAVTAPMNSYIASIRGKLSMGRAIAIPVGSFNMGAIAGPLLGGFISQLAGLRIIYWMAFAFFVISAILAFFLKEKEIIPHDEQNDPQKPWKNKSFNLFLGLIFMLVFCAYLPMPLTANFLFNYHHIPFSMLGILGALTSLGYIILAFFASHLKPENNISLSILLIAAFCGLILLGNSIWLFGAAYLFASGYRFMRSMIMACSHELIHKKHLGLAFGLIESAAALGVILAPLVAGFIFTKNPYLLYQIGIIILIICFIIQRWQTKKTIQLPR